MKIKVFRFRVSNEASAPWGDNKYPDRAKELISEDKIGKRLTEFMEDKRVVSISVNTVDVKHHNNGGSNIVDLIYTIMFEEV